MFANPGIDCAPASSATGAGPAARAKLGSSLTAPTTIVKLCVALATFGGVLEPLSVTVTATVAVPFVFALAV